MQNNSTYNPTKSLVCAVVGLGTLLCASALPAQTVTVASPPNGAVVTELTSIKGKVSGAGRTPSVRIVLSKHETDLEWADPDGRFEWRNGPTGKWYGTLMSADGKTWSAPVPAWRLPSGRDLPNGTYLITTAVGSKQFRSYFTVKRPLPRAAKDGDSIRSPITEPREPRPPR